MVDASVTAASTGCKYQHHTKCIKLPARSLSYRVHVSSQKTEFTHLTPFMLQIQLQFFSTKLFTSSWSYQFEMLCFQQSYSLAAGLTSLEILCFQQSYSLAAGLTSLRDFVVVFFQLSHADIAFTSRCIIHRQYVLQCYQLDGVCLHASILIPTQ